MNTNIKSLLNCIRILNHQNYCRFKSVLCISYVKNKQQCTVTPLINIKRYISKKEASKKLQDILHVPLYKANSIVFSEDNFSKFSSTDQIEEAYNQCCAYGLSNKIIQTYPTILADTTIKDKVNLLKTLPYDINVTAPLLKLRLKNLKIFLANDVGVNRISQLAIILQTDLHEVCKQMAGKPFLISINLENLKETLKILLDAGITSRAILSDIWVLRYSPCLVKERIDMIKENNLDVVKTWMIRAQREIVDNYIKIRSDKKKILGDKNDLIEYLSEKLECSSEVSNLLVQKQPALQKKSLRKMDEMIDFLLVTGFKPIHICRTPKILLHSVDTIKKRLKELEANNVRLDSLHVLTKSQRQYMSVFDSMISNKSKVKIYLTFILV